MLSGKDFPNEFLEDLYQRITEEEIKMDIDNLQYPTAMRKGWVQLSNNRKERTARRRFLILTDSSLMYFAKNGEPTPLGVALLTPTEGAAPTVTKESAKKSFVITLTVPAGGGGGVSPAPAATTRGSPAPAAKDEDKTVYQLQLSSEMEMNAWFKALSYVLQMGAPSPVLVTSARKNPV